jgi:tuftelin-interacting protein 11
MQNKHNQNGKPDAGGDWQKNTKGFGLKFMQKFGFKGRLGAKEDGVSGTIEVVNRPAGQGLGFGDFVEASSLKSNKKLAAEWKGVEYVEEKEEEIETNKSGKRKISLVEVITKSQSWKKGKDNSKEKVFYTASEFLNRNNNKDEIVSNKNVILDMRGEESRILTDLSDINKDNYGQSISETINNKALFGEELIYNLNLMVDLVDKDVNSCSINLKNESFMYDNSLISSKNLDSQLQKDNIILEKLDNLMAIFNKIDTTLQNSPSSLTIESISSLFSTIYSNFTEEFRLYSLLSLLPFLTSQVISKYFIDWNPLLDPSLSITVLSSFNELITFFNNNNEKDLSLQTSKILENISDSIFTPILRNVLINEWNVFEPYSCIELWLNLKQLLPKSNQIEESIIIPKLTTAVEKWIPSLDDKSLNYWILPWVKILKAKLSGLYPTIRRKLSQALKSWNPLEDSAINMLTPWQSIFDSVSMENLLIRSIIPKLVISLRSLEINPNNQQLSVFYSFIKWHNVIPNSHFISLFVGEFFVKWMLTLCIWLNSSPNLVEVQQWYSLWKNLFNQIDNNDILFLDMEILKCYNFSLNMINLSINIKENENNNINNDINIKELRNILDLLKIEIDNINYFKILEMKKYKNKVNNIVKENKINKMNSNAISSISYIEYVETFALNNNIDFIPKLGKSYQGHSLYLFGSYSCYVDQNVLYYSDNTSTNKIYEWNPISLEELLILEGK